MTVTSVLAPGFCLSTAGVFALIHAKVPGDTWNFIIRETLSMSTPLAITLGLLLVSLSFIIGYISRELAFWVIGLLSRFPRYAPPDATAMLDHLRILYGDDRADSFLLRHPDLKRWLTSPPAPTGSRAGGGHRPDWGFHAFEYCKKQLRRVNPEAVVDETEMEINMLASFLMPPVVFVADAIWTLGTPAFLTAALCSTATALCVGNVNSIVRLREGERYEALENLTNFSLQAGSNPPSPTPPAQPAA
ncbi:hypothetical protein ACIQVK_26795 [Streptomyces sp. NPDC090493]|uniref:hypothetical protein n=1 Tax=Streptomyces sp. NPDC090493 TaxID=3365964 RepID=UPI00381F8AC8